MAGYKDFAFFYDLLMKNADVNFASYDTGIILMLEVGIDDG